MKVLRLVTAAVFLAAIFSPASFAQTTQSNRVFVIDTGAFADEKEGIEKFINASKKIEEEMKARYTELETLAKTYQNDAKQLQTLKEQYDKNPNGPISPSSLLQKNDALEKMQIEYKRKEEDLKLAVTKRSLALLDPIRVDIYKAMDVFAKEKGYPIILDLVQLVETKLILAIGDSKVDVTDEFIKYFNALPAGSANK